MSTLLRASRQWATRPADERFLSIPEMIAAQNANRERSKTKALANRRIELQPSDDKLDGDLIVLDNETGEGAVPTHWAFNQLAGLVKAPPAYLRTLPTPLVADAINWGLRYSRDITDVGIMTRTVERSDTETSDARTVQDEYAALMCATGPNYGRVWNGQILEQIERIFGDGRSGNFRVPGEFGKDVPITRDNTTLYAGDRDCFVFLADEANRIEVPNRRNGEPGQLARGFFIWNSEVGSTSLGVATFLYDYVCMNRMVWGAMDYQEVRVRHTVSAPEKFVEQIAPALNAMRDAPTLHIRQAIENARANPIASKQEEINEWLAKRFSARFASAFQAAHLEDEGRPIETLYDAANGVTAYARGINYQDQRVAWERKAGELIELAQ